MFAPGAIACTASTSSVSSPYQPCGSCTGPFFGFFAPDTGRPNVPGATTCENCPPFMVGWPCSVAYWLASAAMVGEAYASMIATVCPLPSLPAAMAPLTPYPLWSWPGTYPHGANGVPAGVAGRTVPSSVGVVAAGFSPQ